MRPRLIFPILVATALAGCATDPAPIMTAPAPVLPSPPAGFGKPVAMRPPKVGEDARAYAAREKAGRLAANRRLANDAAFYADVVGKLSAH